MGGVSMRGASAPVMFVALLAALGLAASAAAFSRPGLPVEYTLPSGWTQTATTAGDRFDATGPGGVKLALTVGGTYPMSVPFSFFVSTETTAAKQHYRSEDPHASVSGAKIMLPSGPAVLIKAVVHHGGAPTAIYLYSFLHNGVTYHFTFFANGSSMGSSAGGVSAFAKSVHFTK